MGIRFNTEEERKSHPQAQRILDKEWFDHTYFNGELDEISQLILSLHSDFFLEKDCKLPKNHNYSIKHLYCVLIHTPDLGLDKCLNLMKDMKLNVIQLAEILIRTQSSQQLQDLVELVEEIDAEKINDENTQKERYGLTVPYKYLKSFIQKEIYGLAVRHNDLNCVIQLETKILHNGGDKAYTKNLLKNNDFEIYVQAILGNSVAVLTHLKPSFNFQIMPEVQNKCLALFKSSAQQGATDCLRGLRNLFNINNFKPDKKCYREAFTLAALNGHVSYLKILVEDYKPSPKKLYALYEQVIIGNDDPKTLQFLQSTYPFNHQLLFDFEKKDRWYSLALQHKHKEVFFHLLTQNIDAIYHFAQSTNELTQDYIKEYMRRIVDIRNFDVEEDKEQKFNAFIAILTILKRHDFLPGYKWQSLLEIKEIADYIREEELRMGLLPVSPANINEESAPEPTDVIHKEHSNISQPEDAAAPLKSIEIPEQPKPAINSSEKNQDKISTAITTTYKAYELYTRGIRFCLFHVHGEKGIRRANSFRATFNKSLTIEEQKHNVVDYLQNTENGNTHPHSFRTMLLAQLLDKELSDESLRDVSANFLMYLDQYSTCAPNELCRITP